MGCLAATSRPETGDTVVSLRLAVAVVCLGAAAWPAHAQTARPAAAGAASAPLSAEMERVQRQAANPLRIIMEASRPRRRAIEPEPAEVDATNLRRVNSRGSSAGPGSVAAAAPAPTPPEVAVITPRGVAVAPRSAVAAAAPVAEDEAAITTEVTISAELLPARRQAEVPPLEAPVRASEVVGIPKAAEVLPLPAAAPPKLVNMVGPAVAPRVLLELGRVEIEADLSLRADGTVASVQLIPPVPRALLRPTQQALEQWRFEPLGVPRVHRVQLVFNGE